MENNKKLTRASAGNRMVAGVCAGIADYFGWDPTLLRIVYVLATIFTAFAGIMDQRKNLRDFHFMHII